LLYTGTSARVAYALGRNGWWPEWFSRLSYRGIPIVATVLSFAVGIVVFLPFPGWQKLVGFITAASSLSYGMACIALSALRRQDPERDRPFRLPFANVLSPFGFVVAGLVVYWSGWSTVWRLMVALAIGFLVWLAYRLFGERSRMPRTDLRPALWLPPYLGGLALISYLGRYDGRNVIPFWWDIGVVAAFSLAIFALAVHVRLRPEEARGYIENLDPMLEEPELDDAAADAPLARGA
jgi:amino acid transporter